MSTDRRSYTTIDVAKRLGVSLQTVQRWVDAGHLKAWKTLGGHRRIDAESAEALFKSKEEGSGGAPEAPADVAAGAVAAVRSRPAVVVVDDDPLDRKLLVLLVRQALPDAQIEVAGNGFQALVIIGKTSPEIVITDIHMPHMDGFEMIRQLLSDHSMRPRTLIAVSALSADGLAELGQLPSEVLFFTKPVNRERFVETLRERQAVSAD